MKTINLKSPLYPVQQCLICTSSFYSFTKVSLTVSTDNLSCDHVTGKFECRPGYIGPICQHTCPSNSYGQGCLKKCDCEYGDCHHVTGKDDFYPWFKGQVKVNCTHFFPSVSPGACHCYPGYTGSNCKKKCPIGKYGINCGLSCKCQNGGSCRAIDGVCHCKPGFTGPTCSEGQYTIQYCFNFKSIVEEALGSLISLLNCR